jgi:hypothetical protein
LSCAAQNDIAKISALIGAMSLCSWRSFYHFVGADQQAGRKFDPERLRRFEVEVSSILTACSTGRSAGFSPLRMRPV